MALQTVSFILHAGQSLSDPVDCTNAQQLIRLIVPDQWTAAPLTFRVSPDNVEYHDLYRVVPDPMFKYEVTVPMPAAGSSLTFPVDTGFFPGWIRVRSGTCTTPVLQAQDGIFTLVFNTPDSSAGGPAGPAGPQGPAGLQGPTGPIGAQGVIGPVGPAGGTGPVGVTGPPGAQGIQGSAGSQGLAGAQGVTGPVGPAGNQGPQGIPGSLGPTGPQGVVGSLGPTGPAVPGPAGATGPQGTPGAAGPTGAQGAQGTLGLTGPAGTPGASGPTGAPGVTGAQGSIGMQGPVGSPGAQGLQGPTGLQGSIGPQGATGPSGPTVVSADAGNQTRLGSDHFIFTPAPSVPIASTFLPVMDGTAAAGSSIAWSPGDHVHPSDTSRVPTSSPRLVLAGGTTGQVLAKNSGTDYDMAWVSGYRPPILSINGAMAISQELGFGGGTVGSFNSGAKYLCDGFLLNTSGISISCGDAQTSAPGISGITNYLVASIAAAKTSLASSDTFSIQTIIEGTRCTRLQWGSAAAQPISVGFWILCTLAGTATLSVANGSGARTYLLDFAVTASNTWQWVTVTIPGDVSGTWATDNTQGMYIRICACAGAGLCGVAGWQAGNLLGTAGTMNLATTVGNNLYVAGFIVVPGSILPAPQNVALVLPTYDQELLACKRYYEKDGLGTILSCNVSTGNNYYAMTRYSVEKRIVPTVTLTNQGAISFPTTPTLNTNLTTGLVETRTANATGPGFFQSTWFADARL